MFAILGDYRTYKNWQMLWDSYEDFGHKNVLEMIASFGGAKDVSGMDQFKNLLCWYAIEERAHEIADEIEEDENGLSYYPMHTTKLYLTGEK